MNQREIEILASHYNMSPQDVMQVLDVVDYAEAAIRNEHQKIMDRINKRLQGEFVAPAWVEALRRK